VPWSGVQPRYFPRVVSVLCSLPYQMSFMLQIKTPQPFRDERYKNPLLHHVEWIKMHLGMYALSVSIIAMSFGERNLKPRL
jgi:hypothetical protein